MRSRRPRARLHRRVFSSVHHRTSPLLRTMKQYVIPALVGILAGIVIERMWELSEKVPGLNSLPKA